MMRRVVGRKGAGQRPVVAETTRTTTPKSAPRRRDEAGDTLVEVLLAIIVLGMASVALLIAFGTTISASAEHRNLVTYNTVLATATQETISAIESQQSYFSAACPSTISSYPGYGGISLPAPYATGQFSPAGSHSVQYATASAPISNTNPIEYWNGTSYGLTCHDDVSELITIYISGTTDSNSFVVDYPVQSSTGSQGAAVATNLIFLQEPSGGYSGSPLTTQPIVEVASGSSAVSTDLSPVILAIDTSSTGVGTLGGCQGNEILGVVTFTGCTVDSTSSAPNNTFALLATDGDLTPAVSAPQFTVTNANFNLAFAVNSSSVQIAAGASGSPFTTPPTVDVDNSGGSINTAWAGTVTLTFSGGQLTNCGSGTATSITLQVSNGVTVWPSTCDFSGGYFYNPNSNPPTTATQYIVTATANPTAPANAAVPAQSNTFSVTGPGPATQLAFGVQPTGVANSVASTPFTGQPTVVVEDAYGNVVTSATNTVTLTMKLGSTVETLNGCSSPTGNEGQYVFTGCAGTTDYNGLVLVAASTGLTSATSSPFNITGPATQLLFKTSPTADASGSTFAVQPVLVYEDASNNVVTAVTSAVSFSVNPSSGWITTCTGLAPSSGYVYAGNCEFAGLVGTQYTLTATGGGLTGTSLTFSPTAPGPATQLVYTVEPVPAASGSLFATQPTIKVEDSAYNVVTTSGATLTLTSSGGTLAGCGGLTANAGVVIVSNCTFAGVVGTQYSITATTGSLSGTSTTFTPTGPGPLSQIVLTGCTTDELSGTTCSLSATLEDNYSNIETGDNASQLTFNDVGGTGTVSGLVTETVSGGVASDTITSVNIGPESLDATADGFTSNVDSYNILPIPQTINWTPPGSQTFVAGGAGTFSLGTATDTSGSAVTFASSTPSVCTVSGGTATMVGAGTCTITPTATAQGNYALTPGSPSTITINQAAQTIAFYTTSGYTTTTISGSTTYSPSGTYQTYAKGNGGGTVTFASTSSGVCTIDPNSGQITFVTAGTCTVTADAATNTNFLDSGTTTFTLTIARATQATLVITSTSATYNGSAFTLPMTTSGGSGGGAITYAVTNGTASGCSIPASTLTATTSGTCLVTATEAASADYLQASSAQTTVTFNKAAQATLVITSTSATYNGGAFTLPMTTSGGSGGGAITYAVTNGTASGCSVPASTLTATTSGTCLVTATEATSTGYLQASSAQTTVTFNKASQSVAFYTTNGYTTTTTSGNATYSPSGTYQTYAQGSGAGNIGFASTTPSVCTVGATSGLVTIVSAGTCTITADAATDTGYLDSGTTTFTLAIAQATQATLTITSTSANYTGSAFTLAMTTSGGSGGGAITYAVTNGTASGCSVPASTLTATSAGTCLVTATEAASTDYLATSSVQTTVTFSNISQSTLTITSTSATFNGSAFTLPMTTSGGSGTGTVTYTVTNGTATGCSVPSTTLTASTSGTCLVTATKAASTGYNVASSVQTTVTFNNANQSTLTITSTSATYTGSAFTLAMTTSGGSGTGGVSYSVTNGTATGCSVPSSTLTASTAGTCLVTATEAASTGYNATSSVQTTVTFNNANQATLVITSTSATYNGSAFTLSMTTSGGSGTGGVTYAVTNGTAMGCSVPSSTLTATTAGTCLVTATEATSTGYNATSSVQTTVTFSNASQAGLTITSTSATYNGSAFSLPMTTSGGTGSGAVTYAVTNGTASGCSVPATTLTATGPGTCLVTATKAASTGYNSVSSVQTTVTFSNANQATLTITSTSATYTGSAFTLPMTTSGGSGSGAVTYALTGTGTASGCSLPATTLTATGPGTCLVTATEAASTGYNATSSVQTTVTFSNANQATLAITSMNGNNASGSYSLTLTSTGGSGSGAVTYALTGTGTASGCSITTTTLSATSSGTCLVTATRAASTGYNQATSVQAAIIFSPKTTITGFTSTNQSGTPGAGDTMTMTFSAALNPSTICSIWSSAGTAYSSNVAVVTLSNPTSGNDTMSITDSACTGGLNYFASNVLNLGAAGYVGGTAPSTAVFSPSTIAINAADTVVTITFGTLASGSVANVATNPGVTYLPSSSILDQNGNPISGSFTDSTTKFF